MAQEATLTFYGAAGTVTGSKHLIRFDGEEILLDAGLFQGLKSLRLRNWEVPPFDPSRLAAVVLSHAHIDHSGYLPVLARSKFSGPVYCSPSTASLLDILLKDSAKLQEEDARYANKRGFSKHKPALPLYTGEDVRRLLSFVQPKAFHQKFKVTSSVSACLHYAGHILGASIVELLLGSKNPLKVIFSGDLGRWNQPLIKDPELIEEADILILESTYGNREHPDNAEEELARVINETAARKGALIIPAFAVGRTQELIWMIRKLEDEQKIPSLQVYVDSPMAVDVTALYEAYENEYDAVSKAALLRGEALLQTNKFSLISDYLDSKKINRIAGPVIIISSSGMMTGGRVLHHLESRIENTHTTVLLAGFQAAGTRGRLLKEGAESLRFHGKNVRVRAHVECIDGLSAHADQKDILRWLSGFRKPPRKTFIVHGEPESAQALRDRVAADLGWDVEVAEDSQTVSLGTV